MYKIPLFKVFMSDSVFPPLIETLKSGYISQGQKVEDFEKILKNYIGNEYLLTLNSATAGLTLALRLLKNPDESFNWKGFNEEEDIVLTPALTCFATSAAILANNVNIRWIDVDLETANICLKDLKNKLSEKTKVIYLVHWGGNPVDLDELKEIQEYSLKKFGFKPMIVEDCAHAFGAEFKGKKLGNHENICVYSLQAIKHLTTGDGGIITLPNKSLYERCKLLRWFGIDRNRRNYKGKDFRLEHDIEEYGYKFHMNDLNAVIGIHNFPEVLDLIKINRDNGEYYDNNLKNIKGVKLMKNNSKCNSSYWLYTIRVDRKYDFMEYMKKEAIMVSQVHNRNDVNSCVEKYSEELPNIDKIEQDLVCIPVGWWVTKKDREYIVEKIKNFYK